ncbi:hypothetical protein BDV19DRAFT_362296 [Aspergillus venezuelensis]
MPYTILALLRRKPGTTPSHFKTYYETKHIPLLKEIAGPDFPTFHKRYYLPRTRLSDTTETAGEPDTSNAAFPAPVIAGTAEDFQFDVYAEVIFRDEGHFAAFRKALGRDAEVLARDEEMFLDRARIQVVRVDEPCVAMGE